MQALDYRAFLKKEPLLPDTSTDGRLINEVSGPTPVANPPPVSSFEMSNVGLMQSLIRSDPANAVLTNKIANLIGNRVTQKTNPWICKRR
jgi:hypothetical protein